MYNKPEDNKLVTLKTLVGRLLRCVAQAGLECESFYLSLLSAGFTPLLIKFYSVQIYELTL